MSFVVYRLDRVNGEEVWTEIVRKPDEISAHRFARSLSINFHYRIRELKESK